jgi:hypothetical protein
MVDAQTVSIVFAGLSIGIAAIYYTLTIRNSQRNQELALKAQEQALVTRQTQIFMQIYQQLNSEEAHASWAELVNQEIDYEDFIQKYDSTVNPNHYAKRAHLWYSLNTIGELLRQGLIDIDLVHRFLLGPQVILMWERWESIIMKIRVREDMPDMWEGFEYLYNEMKRLRDSRGYPKIKYPIPT